MARRCLPRLAGVALLLRSRAAGGSAGECFPAAADPDTFHCFSPRGVFDRSLFCRDAEDAAGRCADWAGRGECARNPGYMLLHCSRSCEACTSPSAGAVQVRHTDEPRHVDEAFLREFAATQEYLRDAVAAHPRRLASCLNHDPFCTVWAARGECAANAPFMRERCAAACRACAP